MQLLFSSRELFWLCLVGLVLAGSPSVAQQTGPGPGFPGGPGPFNLPNIPVTGQNPYFPGVQWWGPGPFTGQNAPYPGWNQPWVGYNPNNAPAINPNPCPGDILKNPQQLAPSKPGSYIGGTFGYTRTNTDGSLKYHGGLDVAANGTPFKAAYGGVVTRVERNFGPNQYGERSFGNYVEVRSVINGQEYLILYGHMNFVGTDVQPGVTIRSGAPLGLSGRTGNAGDNPRSPTPSKIVPHVHIQARDANGNRVNPEPLLKTKFDHTTGRSINLPC